MIENLLGGGGGGGTVDTITAGTGISVDSTDPANPIITNTSLNTDEVAKVSSNDTTAGYLNGKLVAGSGIALTENNNGGNETLTVAIGNHDASLITTGTVATARLGTGTANSTTYLRGDQTWASVAAGDTTYTVTTADAENTTTKTKIATFTIPANTWSDGQTIELILNTNALNNSGSTNLTLVMETQGTGITTRTSGISYIGSVATPRPSVSRLKWTRYGTNVMQTHYNTVNPDTPYYDLVVQPFSTVGANSISNSSSVNFATNITLDVYCTLGTANAAYYVRVEAARATKYNGGNV
jgi:hypothetical protein